MAHVLVADDQAFVRHTIRALLAERTTWRLSEAQNGRAALETTKKNHPDVVVLDLVMPEMGGLAAAYEIGKVAPNTKIVFISSYYTPEQASSVTRNFGTARFIDKSALEKDLVPTIKHLLKET